MSVESITLPVEVLITTTELDVLQPTQMLPFGPSPIAVGWWLG
jgi:hypothetical protein